jgi:hypothetical protein
MAREPLKIRFGSSGQVQVDIRADLDPMTLECLAAMDRTRAEKLLRDRLGGAVELAVQRIMQGPEAWDTDHPPGHRTLTLEEKE